jgi:DNA mismatch repair protein MutL
MTKIKVLPDILANKIAAGEVVERPASVVKELIENSLDAGARRIRVEVEAGGKRSIRITDDGEGMTRDDAILAFERHATSKLREIEDLETIQTLGFRGEALPSIASVSRVSLRTKTAEDLEGTEIEIEGGRMLKVNDLAWPGGTEIAIQELFFNIPARRKFLKSDSTESSHIANLVTHYALANPQINFTLIHNGREALAATPVETLRERAYQLFGSDFIEKLIEIETEGEVSVRGFISKPQEQRASRDSQYLFVNGRFVRDRVIARAISEAYKNVIPPGMHPVVMLMIELHSEEVDVNVHPAKTEVRFRRPFAIHEAVSMAIRNAFTETKPFASFPMTSSTAGPTVAEPSREWGTQQQPPLPGAPQISGSIPRLNLPEVDDPFDLPSSSSSQEERSQPELNYRLNFERNEREQSAIAPPAFNFSQPVQQPPPEFTSASTACAERAPRGQEIEPQVDRLPGMETIKPIGQLRDSYIVAIDDQGLMLIDQHVAHERVLFEYHLERVLSRNLEVQQLLIPEAIDLTPAQIAAFELIEEELGANGFEMMRLSGRTVAIKSAPAMLSIADARMLVMELLSVVERERRALSMEDFQREIAASLACHAAIKVNTPLSKEKMQWLIDELLRTKSPTNCPHGRPIILRFSMREIERGFKRI